jgi:MFS family permease
MLDQTSTVADTPSEILFILVATFPYLAPGGYRSLLLGPMVEGLLGGMSTITATINAYLSDVTPDGSRAAVFARLAGTMMVGFASGPVLGSFLIRWSGNMYVDSCADRLLN